MATSSGVTNAFATAAPASIDQADVKASASVDSGARVTGVATAALAAAAAGEAKSAAAKAFDEKAAAAVKSTLAQLSPLFEEGWTGIKPALKVDQLHGLPLEQIIDLSFITLLVGMSAKSDKSQCLHFQKVLLILAKKEWKSLKPGELLQAFRDLGEKIKFPAKEFQGHVIRIQLLINYKDYWNTVLDPSPRDRSAVANYTLALINKFSSILYPISHTTLMYIHNYFQERVNRAKAIKVEGAKADRVLASDSYKSISDAYMRYVALYQTIRGYAFAGFAEVERSCRKLVPGNQDQTQHLATLCRTFSAKFGSKAAAINQVLTNDINWQAWHDGIAYTPESEEFIRSIYKSMHQQAAILFADLIKKIHALGLRYPRESRWPDNRVGVAVSFLLHHFEIANCRYRLKHDLDLEPQRKELDNQILIVSTSLEKLLIKWKSEIQAEDEGWVDEFDQLMASFTNGLFEEFGKIIQQNRQVSDLHKSLQSNYFEQYQLTVFNELVNRLEVRADKMHPDEYLNSDVGLTLFFTHCFMEEENEVANGVRFQQVLKEYKDRLHAIGVYCTGNKTYLDAVKDGTQEHLSAQNDTVKRLRDLSGLIGVFEQIFFPVLDHCKPPAASLADLEDESWCNYIDLLDSYGQEEQPAAEESAPKPSKGRKYKEKVRATKAAAAAAAAPVVEPPKPPAELPYADFSDRQLVVMRRLLSGREDQIVVPQSVMGKNPPLHEVAREQQVFLFDCLQSVSEMIHNGAKGDSQKVLLRFFRLYEDLVAEQGLTAACRAQEPTHDVAELFGRLSLNVGKCHVVKYVKGTIPLRYPFSVSGRHRLVLQNDTEVQQECGSLAVRIADLANIHLAIHPETDRKQMDAVPAVAKTPPAQSSSCEADLKQLNVDGEELEKVLGVLDRYMESESKMTSSLSNVRHHLSNLMQLTRVIREFPQLRFVNVHAHMVLFTVQYLAENLGTFLSVKGNAEMHTHSLRAYCEAFQLGEGLSTEDLQTLRECDVHKGSEYPFGYFGKRKSDAVSQLMLSQGGFYTSSRLARQSFEAGAALTGNPKATYEDFVKQTHRLLRLAANLVHVHFSAKKT